MISLDKIAKKNKLIDSKGVIKKPWEKKDEIDIAVDELILEQRRTKPRFEIPEAERRTLSSVSESLKLLGDVLKM